MTKNPISRKLLASAIAGTLLPAAALYAAPTADAGKLTLTKEIAAPVRHCNSAELVSEGKCDGNAPNLYRVTYAYWVQNRTDAAKNVQIYDAIQKEFGSGATIKKIISVANANHEAGGLYDIDKGVDSDKKDSDGKATTPPTADDDDAVTVPDDKLNSAFTGTTGGDIELLTGAYSLAKNKMLVVVVTFEVELPTPLPTRVNAQTTLGNGTETSPADNDSANTASFYLPAQIEADRLGSTGCATGTNPIGDNLVANGDFSTVVTLELDDDPRPLTATDKDTLKFDSDLPYMGSDEDLYPKLSADNPGMIGINQHAMLGFPTEQMPPHTGPDNWLMYTHKATGGAGKTVWKQGFSGLTKGEEYQFSVLVSNALTPGFKETEGDIKTIYEPTVRLKVAEETGAATTMANSEVTIPLETDADGDHWNYLVGTFTPNGSSATVSIEVTAGGSGTDTTEYNLLGFTDVSLKSCKATTGGSGGGTDGSGGSSGGGGGGALGGLLLSLLGLQAVRRRLR